jgi:3-oxoacyl-[acyl-carrier-protein] synthase III
MHQNIIIKAIGTYHPVDRRDNSFYIKHFEDLGVDVSGLVNHLGRNKRCIADIEKESVITMAYEASVKALKSKNIEPEEIDLIIFGTDSPQMLVPTNALLLHDKLKTTNADQIFDMNANCIGMLSAIDVASRLLISNSRINKALVVGSFMGSLIASDTDPVCYSNLADAAVAIILEKVEETQKRGFIDTNFKTDPIVKDTFQFPVCGFTNMYNPEVDVEDKKLKLIPFDTSFICKEWVDLMDVLFNRYDISKHTIKQYFFSQFSRPDAEATLAMMGLDVNKFTYIGDKYGYTGLTSPLLAFNEALVNETIHTGDYIMFCSVGAGYNICALLYKL